MASESEKSLSERLKAGGKLLTEFATRAAQMERDMATLDGDLAEAQETRDRMEAEARDSQEVFDDLDDMRRGVLTAEEMYDKWLRVVVL